MRFSGNTLWARYVDGPAHLTDTLAAMCLDSDGNILITGTTRDPAALMRNDWLTAKFNPQGDSLWVRRYDRGEHRDDYPVALTTDDAGNVYVLGASYHSTTLWDYQLVKYARPAIRCSRPGTTIRRPTATTGRPRLRWTGITISLRRARATTPSWKSPPTARASPPSSGEAAADCRSGFANAAVCTQNTPAMPRR